MGIFFLGMMGCVFLKQRLKYDSIRSLNGLLCFPFENIKQEFIKQEFIKKVLKVVCGFGF